MAKKWKKEVYDLEVFCNFFSAIFINVDTGEKAVFEISERKNQLQELLAYLRTGDRYLIGYNNKGYDNIILNYLLAGNGFSDFNAADINAKLYDLSQKIINSQFLWGDPQLKKLMWNDLYKSLDLMLIHRFHKLGIGLKQVAVSMKWHRIQDLPLHYTARIIDEHDGILEYNENDVLITAKLFELSLPEIRLRQSISQRYKVDVMNSSRPNIADKLMNKFYSDKTGLEYREFKDLRDNNTTVHFKDIIWDQIEFDTPVFQGLLERLNNTTVVADKGNKDFKEYVVFNECGYDMAKGGLHSVKEPLRLEEDDEYKLIDLDFGSFYPMIMIRLGIYPPHLGKEFLEVLDMITKQRLKAKKDGDKITADALKITINSIYGKLGFEMGYLYSPKSMYAVTINGQLMLLRLIELLEMAGISCFYANTDGATFKVHKSKVEEFYRISDAYAAKINIPIEYANYKTCCIRDVNNYIIETCDGERKIKGAYVGTLQLDKGYDMPVVSLVAERVLMDGADIREELMKHEDLYDFCKSQKVGKQFTIEHHFLSEGSKVVNQMQKTNRYFVINGGSSKLYKVSDTDKLNDLVAGFAVEVFNDDNYESKPEDFDINYGYYSREVRKLIQPFDDSQLTMF